MTEEDYLEIESSKRQWNQDLLQNEQLCNEGEVHIYKMFKALNATLQRDGNQWCALFGEDLQVGVAGFGDSPHEAILGWGIEMKNQVATNHLRHGNMVS